MLNVNHYVNVNGELVKNPIAVEGHNVDCDSWKCECKPIVTRDGKYHATVFHN